MSDRPIRALTSMEQQYMDEYGSYPSADELRRYERDRRVLCVICQEEIVWDVDSWLHAVEADLSDDEVEKISWTHSPEPFPEVAKT